MVVIACNVNCEAAGKWVLGACWAASLFELVTSRPVRDAVSSIKVDSI